MPLTSNQPSAPTPPQPSIVVQKAISIIEQHGTYASHNNPQLCDAAWDMIVAYREVVKGLAAAETRADQLEQVRTTLHATCDLYENRIRSAEAHLAALQRELQALRDSIRSYENTGVAKFIIKAWADKLDTLLAALPDPHKEPKV